MTKILSWSNKIIKIILKFQNFSKKLIKFMRKIYNFSQKYAKKKSNFKPKSTFSKNVNKKTL